MFERGERHKFDKEVVGMWSSKGWKEDQEPSECWPQAEMLGFSLLACSAPQEGLDINTLPYPFETYAYSIVALRHLAHCCSSICQVCAFKAGQKFLAIQDIGDLVPLNHIDVGMYPCSSRT